MSTVPRVAQTSLGMASRLNSMQSVKVIFESRNSILPEEQDGDGVSIPRESIETSLPPQRKPEKSFKLHIGGVLSIPSVNALEKPTYIASKSHEHQDSVSRDPFDGLPFREFAEKLGAAIVPIVEAAREEQRRNNRLDAHASDVPMPPEVPHFLPFTRWAAKSETIRSTFVTDDSNPSKRKKARLSWYHPDDTMVPRDWLSGGLLADIKYYNPFGLWQK